MRLCHFGFWDSSTGGSFTEKSASLKRGGEESELEDAQGTTKFLFSVLSPPPALKATTPVATNYATPEVWLPWFFPSGAWEAALPRERHQMGLWLYPSPPPHPTLALAPPALCSWPQSPHL